MNEDAILEAQSHLDDMEMSLLSSAVDDPIQLAALGSLQVDDLSSWFARDVLSAIRKCLARDGACSTPSVRQMLLEAGNKDAADKFLSYFGSVVTYSSMAADLATIRNASARRQGIAAAKALIGVLSDPTTTLNEVANSTAHLVDVIHQSASVDDRAESLRELTVKRANEIEELERQRAAGEDLSGTEGFTWPYYSWNKTIGLSKPGQLIILAARPKMGKTVVCAQTALHWSRYGCGYYWTGEMDGLQMVDRMIPCDLRIESDRITVGDLKRYQDLAPDLWIDSNPVMTVRKLIARIDAFRAKHPDLKFVVVDHLGLITTAGDYKDTSTAVQTLRQAAGRWKVPVMLLVQLSRKVEDRINKRPLPSDLRESGRIEEEAAKVLLLYRPHYYDKKADRSLALVECPLNRTGAASDNKLEWRPEIYSLFDDYSGQASSGNNFPTHNAPEMVEVDMEGFDDL